MRFLILSACTFILLFSTLLNAQIDTSAQNKSPFAKGTKALLFQISNNFQLQSFQGGLISFKRHFSDKNALRIGVSFSGRHDEDKAVRTSNPPDSTNYNRKTIESYVSTTLYGTFIRYINKDRIIKSYYGVGLYTGYNHSFYGNETYYPGMNIWTFGLLGVFGVEWFPHSNISFSGEYNCSGKIFFGEGYTSKTINGSGTIYKHKIKTSGYGFGEQGVRFGLSVYL